MYSSYALVYVLSFYSPIKQQPVFPALKTGAMLPDMRSYSEQLRIRANEVGADQRTNIISISTLMQEVAGNHAVALWGTDHSHTSRIPRRFPTSRQFKTFPLKLAPPSPTGRTEEGFATEPLMVKLNLIFVMTRMLIRVEDYPRWGDPLEVETWFNKEGKIAARRDWGVTCPTTGRVLGSATSTWVMINTKTRRLAKLPTELIEKLEPFTPSK